MLSRLLLLLVVEWIFALTDEDNGCYQFMYCTVVLFKSRVNSNAIKSILACALDDERQKKKQKVKG